MLLDELEARLNRGLQGLEESFQQQCCHWQQTLHELQRQLEQSQRRERELHEQNLRLIQELNAQDIAPNRSPLLQTVKRLATHIDALAEETAAFRRTCQE